MSLLACSVSQQPQHKAFTGRVTKLLDNFGFVDDDVFFQLSVVRGGNVKVGDQVYVDCTYSEHLPFKWNAKCVQLLDQKPDMAPSPYMTHPGVLGGREPVDPRKAAGFYREEPKSDSMYQQNRNAVFVSEYNTQPDASVMAQGHNVSQSYQQQMPQAVSTYGNIERDFKSAGFPSNEQITYTSTPGSAFVSTQIQPTLPTVQPQVASRPANPNRGSRWEARNDNARKEEVTRSRPENDRQHREGRDQFGRDKYGRDRGEVRHREREPERPARVTESPASNVGSTLSRPRYRPSDNILRYEVLKQEILANDVKERYGDKLRIPSDFEVLMVNKQFEIDIQTIPKPIKYKFKDSRREGDRKDRKSLEKVDDQDKKEENGDLESMEIVDESQDVAEKEDETGKGNDVEVKQENDSAFDLETSETATVKTENATTEAKVKVVPKIPKYGVKVVMLSIPSMSELYEEVCGYDFTKQITRNHNTYFNRLVSFISFKNQNNGYSLVGGKFNLELDGFIPGTEKPNLIGTAIRTVKEQTGVDLTPCSKWINIGTFVYNRNDSVGDDREYSVVFLPDVWSLLDSSVVSNVKEEMKDMNDKNESVSSSNLVSGENVLSDHRNIEQPQEKDNIGEDKKEQLDITTELSQNNDSSSSHVLSFPTICVPSSSEVPTTEDLSTGVSENQKLLDHINELKVTELKSHLDERDIKYKSSAKKAELVSILSDAIKSEIGTIQLEQQATDANTTNGPSNASEAPTTTEPSTSVVNEATEPTVDAEGGISTETGTAESSPKAQKRRHESGMDDSAPAKKSSRSSPQTVGVVDTGCCANILCVNQVKNTENVINVSGELHLMTLSLYQALNHHKNDHFELGLTAELLREALVKHFTEYCLSCLVANHKSGKLNETEDRRKTQPPTFVHLAFAYFDDNVRGFLLADDLLHNVQNCGYKISRRSWNALTSSNDRISYKSLEVPPSQTVLPNIVIKNPLESDPSEVGGGGASHPIFTLNGITYDGANLVSQSDKYDKSLNQVKEMTDQLETQSKLLKEFETKQKKMTSAIEKQNDEMCSLKRERESLKIKNEELKRTMESCIGTMSDVLKKNKDE